MISHDEATNIISPRELRMIDPTKLAQWTLETACAMVDHAVSKRTLEKAAAAGELELYKCGRFLTVEPAKFLLWYRRFRK